MLNNKGMAISAILYSILVLFLVLLFGILTILASSKYTLDKLKSDILNKFENTSDTVKVYNDGTLIIFNPETGKTCTFPDDNSDATASKKGCLTWFIFGDSSKNNYVNMILTHNTTPQVAWNATGNSNSGPVEALTALYNDTSSWYGVETRRDIFISTNYNVSYNNYRARFLTTDEIAKITGNTTWNKSSVYYFDSKTSSPSTTCTLGNTSDCKYSWLYTDTSSNCKDYGCSSNSDLATSGFWTINQNDSASVWAVKYTGSLSANLSSYSTMYGVRPVISVAKSVLK